MKTKCLLVILAMSISFTIVGQKTLMERHEAALKKEKETFKKPVEDLRAVFAKMFNNAQFVDTKVAGPCKPVDLVSKIEIYELKSGNEKLIKEVKSIKDTYLNYPQHLNDAQSRDYAYSFETGDFNSMEDAALNAFSNTNKFIDFVKLYTGGDVGDLNEYDIKTVRGQYDNLNANYNKEFQIETGEFMSLICGHKQTSFIKLKKLNYPNVTWEIRTVVTADCDCSGAAELTKNIKRGSIEYTAEVTGLLTTKSVTFSNVANAKVTVKSLVCCSKIEKAEESKIAINDVHDAKGYLQVGAQVGLPLGQEKDFYSLTFGAEVSYLFNVSESFNAGIGVGYTHFSPKEFTVGSTTFKGDGIGYIPIVGLAQYDVSKKINLNVNFGYALSTKSDVDGGLNYGVDIKFKIAPALWIGPEINIINLGESRSFNSIGIGVLKSFTRGL